MVDLSFNKLTQGYFDLPTKIQVQEIIKNRESPETCELSFFGKVFGKALQANNTVVHLDLSFNEIKQNDTAILGHYLVDNHTIFGIHFKGNEGEVDSLGFLHPTDPHKVNLMQFMLDREIKGANPKMFGKTNSPLKAKSPYMLYNDDEMAAGNLNLNHEEHSTLTNLDKCWICEQWVEMTFKVYLPDIPEIASTWTKEKPADPDTPINVFIHFDFDNFEPDLMTDLHLGGNFDKEGHFKLYRMVPRYQTLYFFSYKGVTFIDKK